MRTGVLAHSESAHQFNPPPPSSSSALCVPPANTESNADAQLQESSVKWFAIKRELSNKVTSFQVKRSPSTTSFAQLVVTSPPLSARKTPRLSTVEAPSLWTTPQGISLSLSRFISTRMRRWRARQSSNDTAGTTASSHKRTFPTMAHPSHPSNIVPTSRTLPKSPSSPGLVPIITTESLSEASRL